MGREIRRFAWAARFVAVARPVARDVRARSTVRARPARAEVGVGARGEFSRFAGRASLVARRRPVCRDKASLHAICHTSAGVRIGVRREMRRFA